MIGAIILQIVLIALNAVFAAAEIAVISMNDAKLKRLVAEGDRRAARLAVLTEQPSRFLATIQVAITLAGLLSGAFAADNFADPLVDLLVGIGISLPRQVLRSVCVVLITLVLTYFNLVLGELVPKRIAMKKAEQLALGMSGTLYMVSKVFAPLVWLLTASTNGLLRVFGLNPEEEEAAVTEEDIRMMLAEGKEKGSIPREETELIKNVFEFDDITAEQVCTHRKDVVSLYMEDDMAEWEQTIFENRHTYYLVCGETGEEILGVLDTKEYFRMKDKTRENVLKHAVKTAFFIPETMKANVLFRVMREQRNYFAVIVDEYGGLSGIVTLHDLLEALVGDINDDKEPEEIQKIGEGTWKIQGSASLADVAEELQVDLPLEEYDTFNGFVCGVAGRIPDDGEKFCVKADGLTIEVHDVERHVIREATVCV